MSFKIPSKFSASLQPQNRKTTNSNTWVRASDWPVVSNATGEVNYLVNDIGATSSTTAVYAMTTTFTRTTGNIYIDWGDGVVNTISTTTATTTNHTYTTGTGATCSRGYSTFVIRVYGDATTRITRANLGQPLGVPPYSSIGLLEAYFGNTTITSYNSYFNYSIGSFPYLEYVKFPTTVSETMTMNSTFNVLSINSVTPTYNSNLYRVDMPTSAPLLTDCFSAFKYCYNLTNITFPNDATAITTLQETFNNCLSLSSVVLPTGALTALTTTQNTFTSCVNLYSIIIPPLSACTIMASMFSSCYNLNNVKLNGWNTTGTLITMSSMFANCVSLEYVYWPATAASGGTFTYNSLFFNCLSLKFMTIPSYMNSSNLNGVFQTCPSLQQVVLPSSMPLLSSINDCFNGCNSLENIVLPSTVSATITLTQTFNNCYRLTKLIIPSSWNIIGSLVSTFNGCFSLTSITFPTTTGVITNLQNTFASCYNLESITLPTANLGSVISMNQAFYRTGISSFSLPATMNSCTDMGSAFRECYRLTSITLPTSMSVCTGWSNAFLACSRLRTLTLPATTGNITSYLQMVQFAGSLETLTLPSATSSTALTDFRLTGGDYAPNLRTINNLDKVGNPSTSSVIYIQAGTLNLYAVNTLDFYCKFSILNVGGASATTKTKLNSLRLRNTGAGQYAGSSPQINISHTDLGQAALVQVFNDLPTLTLKTINITGSTGAASLTAGERLIATNKGWTITG